jgi:hypothetical protein
MGESPSSPDATAAGDASPSSSNRTPLRDRIRLPRSLAGRKTPPWLERLLADPIGRVVLAVAGIGVCGLSLLVCINLVLLLPGGLGTGISLGPSAATAAAAPTQFEASEALVSSSSVEVPLAIPQTLKFAGQSFPINVATVAEDGAWDVPAGQTGSSFWIYGTLVNYVFGLPDTRDNLAAIDALAKGDTIEVQMSDGRAFRFQVSQKLSVPAGQAGIFAQNEPGLTLALVGGRGESRLVIEALFVGQSGGAAAGVAEIYELGQPAQAGDLSVTVTATRLVSFGAPELPSGLAYFLVDYVVENTGPGPLEASLFVSELIDSSGAHYAPVIPVSAVTTHPPLAGRINPNDVVNASAAYLVAATFSDLGSVWQFGMGVGPQETVQVNLASTVVLGPAVNVTLKAAALNDDKSELVLTGTVVNLGQEPIAVTETDLALISGTGRVGDLVRSEPPLPWTLDPAAFLSYEIAYARPANSSVIFRLLGWEFELVGVQ